MVSDELARVVQIFYLRQGFFAKAWKYHHAIIITSLIFAVYSYYNPLFLIKIALQVGPIPLYIIAIGVPLSYVFHLVCKEVTHAKIELVLAELDRAFKDDPDTKRNLERLGSFLPFLNGYYIDCVRLQEFCSYVTSTMGSRDEAMSLVFVRDLTRYIRYSPRAGWLKQNFSIY